LYFISKLNQTPNFSISSSSFGADYDTRDNNAWMFSFTAAMVPFTAFCFGHSKGLTGRVLEKIVKLPFGFYGIFALPFVTLGIEKSIYDTAQSIQGIDPNVRPADRGGFPSGGADLPSFSLVPVQKRNIVENITGSRKGNNVTDRANLEK
jgi:hypothetical protein